MFNKLLTTLTVSLSHLFYFFPPPSLAVSSKDKNQPLASNGSEIPREKCREKGHGEEVVTVHTARLKRSPPETKSRSPFCLTAGEKCVSKLFKCYGGGRNGSYGPRVRSAHYMLMTWNTDRAEQRLKLPIKHMLQTPWRSDTTI